MNPRTRSLVIGFGLMVLAAVLVVVFVVRLSTSPDAKVQLGDDTFEVGRVRELAPPIDRDGPLLFQALQGKRDIWVQHIGGDATKGWLAFEAHAPGQPRRCDVEWHQDRGEFEDECTHVTYPVDGKGLVQYPTDVKRKKKAGLVLYVDLRSALPES
jgi:hypothetical protein